MRGFYAASAFGLVLACPVLAQGEDLPYADLVERIAREELSLWITDPFLLYAIEEQNIRHADLTAEDIAALDARWVIGDRTGAMIVDLLDRQASILLRDRRERAGGVITEIIVMDRFGLNAAISDPTSDYYQGDEAKYQETFLIGPGAVHVSEIEFDESTGVVQTQVSMTVQDPQTGEPIGAVTFGIDLDAIE